MITVVFHAFLVFCALWPLIFCVYSLYQGTLCCFSSITLYAITFFLCDSSNIIFARNNSKQECDTAFENVHLPDTTPPSMWCILSSNISTLRHMCDWTLGMCTSFWSLFALLIHNRVQVRLPEHRNKDWLSFFYFGISFTDMSVLFP